MSEWSVIAIVKEPWVVLERFISWHLDQGARAVHLVFDDPDDPCLDLISGIDEVKPYRATPEFWRLCKGTKEATFTGRQSRAMLYLYRQISSGWVLNADGDELLTTYGRTVSEILSDQSSELRSILVSVAEHVGQDVQTGRDLFRRPHQPRQVKRIYGEFAPYLADNRGLVGHRVGKSIFRSGLEVARIHPHWPVVRGRERIIDGMLGPEQGIEVLHFYARSYDGWREKLSYRIEAHSRGSRDLILDELRRLMAARDEAGLMQMYNKMHRIDARQTEMMRKRDLLAEVEIDYPILMPPCLP